MTLLLGGAWAVFLFCLAGAPIEARAEPSPLDARVLWVRGERVFIASLDSAVLEPGTRLTFTDRGKRVAAGEVTVVHEGELVVARVTSGTLEKAKKLERIKITAERRALRAAPPLRVGYPSERRSSLLFACDTAATPPGTLNGLYRVESWGGRAHRLVRDPDRFAAAPWPDTLLVRLFDEAADEEIALERGELDAAVFWPGEPSAHIREHARWREGPSGTRRRGVVAAVAVEPDGKSDSIGFAAAVRGSLAALNQELFRGDLAPCGAIAGWSAPSDSSWTPPPSRGVRFEVDPSLPGRHLLERYLNRNPDPETSREGSGLARVFYVDAPIDALDSLSLAVADHIRGGDFSPSLRARADSLAAEIRGNGRSLELLPSDRIHRYLSDSLHVACLFAVRCPVLGAPALHPYLTALGPDALVNLIGCRPPGRRP